MKIKRTMIVLALTLTMMLGLTISANAESQKVNGYCYFNGNDVVCDFDTNVIADTVSGLEPGDDVTFEVKFENKYKTTTNWYMRNEALKTLEQSYDRTQNGGYTYILTHVDPKGNETVLFDNSTVGGEYTMPTDGSKTSHGGENTGEGLHQATNAADEWFFIQTLKKGQSGKTRLYVKFDGDSEVNDYMDTNGGLAVRFAVELNKTGTTVNAANAARTVSYSAVKTGDPTNFPLIIGALAAGVVLLIVALRLRKKANDGEEEETGGDDE